MKKKIAYFMHIDWNWIKQRPHFIAEELSLYYDLDVYYVKNYKLASNSLVSNKVGGKIKSIKKIRKVPASSRFKIAKFLEHLLNINLVREININSYDYIWVTSPIILQFLNPKMLLNKKVIYDCMDDIREFPIPFRSRMYLEKLETKLLSLTNICLVSSNRLKHKVLSRGFNKNLYLMFNALEQEKFKLYENYLDEPNSKQSDLFNIVYFGTISKWIDFNLILNLLDIHKDISFTFIGPKDVQLPVHDRINYIGPIKHNDLIVYTQNAHAFIMPFIKNELILSVDPVKVYEYIALCKPAFVLRYDETIKFKDYVILYESLEDLSESINSIKNQPELFYKNLDMENIREFISVNNWSTRIKDFVDYHRRNDI